MKGFELHLWHVVVIFSTIIAGIFKNEISGALYPIIFIREKGFEKNQKIQVLNSASGVWEDITIVQYIYAIPFIKGGGVLVHHNDSNGDFRREKISFTTWRAMRKRSL